MFRRICVLMFIFLWCTPFSYGAFTFPAQQKLDTSGFVVYQVVLDKYKQNEGGQVNVFDDITARLPALATMGVNLIQLTPFQPDGYALKDYYDVSQLYTRPTDGSPTNYDTRIASLSAYIAKAHSLNMKVIMDCVYHGSAGDNILMTTHPEFYKRNSDNSLVINEFGQAQFDFSKPAVRSYFMDVTKYWIENSDIDGCRVDMAHSVPLSYWAALNNEMKKVKPTWIMIGEAFGTQIEYNTPFSGSGYTPGEQYSNVYGFDAVYDFFYTHSITTSIDLPDQAALIKDAWDARTAPNRNAFYNSVDDYNSTVRAVSLEGGNQGMIAASALNFTLNGIPVIFNGMEIGDNQIPSAPYYLWNAPPYPENREVYTALSCVRKNSSPLRTGETTWNTTSSPSSVIAFTRTLGSEKLLFVVNLSANTWTGTITVTNQATPGTMKEITSSEMINDNSQAKQFSVVNSTLSKGLAPFGFSLLTYPNSSTVSPLCETPSTTPPASCKAGDADCNGKVDLIDYEIWRKEFSGILTSLKADFDKSKKVDLIDFEMWRRAFLQ